MTFQNQQPDLCVSLPRNELRHIKNLVEEFDGSVKPLPFRKESLDGHTYGIYLHQGPGYDTNVDYIKEEIQSTGVVCDYPEEFGR